MRNLHALDPLVARRLMSGPIVDFYGDVGDDFAGAFMVRKMSVKGPVSFRVVASVGDQWEHISVSLPNRCPTWPEMAWIADVFWPPGDCLVQYRPPADQYVNCHPYCLHWWRPIGIELPAPPADLVGPLKAAPNA
jgi:hypothetical protein